MLPVLLGTVVGAKLGRNPWHSRSINSWNKYSTEDWTRIRFGICWAWSKQGLWGAMDQSKAEQFQPLQRHFRRASTNGLCLPPHRVRCHSGSCSDGFIVLISHGENRLLVACGTLAKCYIGYVRSSRACSSNQLWYPCGSTNSLFSNASWPRMIRFCTSTTSFESSPTLPGAQTFGKH